MLDAKSVLESLEKYRNYNSKWMLIISLLLPLISFIVPAFEINTVVITPVIITVVASLISILFVIIFFFSNQSLPSAKNGSVGILLVIKAQSPIQYKEIESKFIDNIRDILESANILNFAVMPVDWSKTNKFNLRKKEDITKILRKTKSLYLISANCVEGCSSGKEVFNLNMQYSVLHKTFEDHLEKKFSIDFNELSQNISSIKINKSDDIEEFKISSLDVALTCKYIIGVSLYLSLEFKAANLVLSELYDQVVRISNDRPTINNIKKKVPLRLYEINIIAYIVANAKFFNEDSDRITLLVEMKESITRANRYIPGTYSYYLASASLYILDQRDVANAKIAVGNAKKKANNKVWLFSEAFLVLYEGNNLLTAYRKYLQALKVKYDLNSLYTYIKFILEEDEDKKQLNLALALICCQLNRRDEARKYAQTFLVWLEQEGNSHSEVKGCMEKLIQ
jgi:predicted RNA-binding protein with RPS1 domain